MCLGDRCTATGYTNSSKGFTEPSSNPGQPAGKPQPPHRLPAAAAPTMQTDECVCARVLNDAERLLVAETERDQLSALDEEAAIKLEARIRRPCNKYVSQYRRGASDRRPPCIRGARQAPRTFTESRRHGGSPSGASARRRKYRECGELSGEPFPISPSVARSYVRLVRITQTKELKCRSSIGHWLPAVQPPQPPPDTRPTRRALPGHQKAPGT